MPNGYKKWFFNNKNKEKVLNINISNKVNIRLLGKKLLIIPRKR